MHPRIAVLATILMLISLCVPRPSNGSYLYFSPTGGAWHWDDDAFPATEFNQSWTFVYGARAGYAFTHAFSGELVGLTGTNDAVLTGGVGPSESLRLTELALSLLVHFQSLTSNKIYPFLDLGVGVAIRKGGPTSIDDQHTAFHLGGGIMYVLSPRFALRTNVRDTFFTDKQTAGNLTEQFTVDALELSLGVEFRIPTKQEGSRPE
jgi:opacity protein-like surface antigen